MYPEDETGPAAAAATKQDAVTPAEADDTVKSEEGDEAAAAAKDTKGAKGADGESEAADKDPQDEDADASEAARTLAKRKRSMQDRLDQVTGKYRDAERRAARADRELADLRKKMQSGYDPDQNPELNYSLDQREAARLQRERDLAIEDRTEARMEGWKERVSVFKEQHADFEKVAYRAPIGDETSELISDMDDGPAVAYHLGKNEAEARRIDRLPAAQKAFALGRLAERLTQTPLQRITQAPTPIKNGVSGSKSAGAKPNYAAMSAADYAKVVAAEEKAKHA
jgi:hypothetical protein